MLKIWDLNTGDCIKIFQNDNNELIRLLAFSNSEDKIVQVDLLMINSKNMGCSDRRMYKGVVELEYPVLSMAFNPERNVLAVGYSNGSLKIWEIL